MTMKMKHMYFKMGMGRPGLGLEPGPMAPMPILRAMGRSNLNFDCGPTGPMGNMGRPLSSLIEFYFEPI